MTPTSLYNRETVKNDYTMSVEAYYLKDWQGYDMAQHSHDRMEIMYVLAGSCVIWVGAEKVSLKKNGFILLDAGVPHGLKVGPNAVCRIMNIEFTLARSSGGLSVRDAADNCPSLKRFLSERQPYLVFVDSEDIQATLRSIINCLDTARDGWRFEVGLYSTVLMLAIARLYGEGCGTRSAGEVHVRKAMRFMNQNYFHDIGIGDISAHVGIAAGYLSRVFKKSTGESMVAYLAEIRIRKAKMLLGRTELPIVEISGYVGVPSRQYFNELFRKHTGMTPGGYRRAVVGKP